MKYENTAHHCTPNSVCACNLPHVCWKSPERAWSSHLKWLFFGILVFFTFELHPLLWVSLLQAHCSFSSSVYLFFTSFIILHLCSIIIFQFLFLQWLQLQNIFSFFFLLETDLYILKTTWTEILLQFQLSINLKLLHISSHLSPWTSLKN